MLIDLKNLVHFPSRSGRDLQRYHNGRRQVVGCIPYRLVDDEFTSSVDEMLEVLMVSSQKGESMMFPKGGWEEDESSMEEAALRESLEEAGVIGSIQLGLGKWIYKSKNQDTLHDGYMFPLLVEEQLDYWPEKDFRQRKWVTVKEAKELCAHIWMTEALELLVQRLANVDTPQVSLLPCFPETASSLYHLQATLCRDEGEASSGDEGEDSPSLYRLPAPLSSDEGEASSSSHISVIAQMNLVEGDGQLCKSFKSNPRKVESEVSSFTICSLQRVKRGWTVFQQCSATCTTTTVVS